MVTISVVVVVVVVVNNNNEVVLCSLLVLDSLHYRWSRAPRGVGSPDWRRR